MYQNPSVIMNQDSTSVYCLHQGNLILCSSGPIVYCVDGVALQHATVEWSVETLCDLDQALYHLIVSRVASKI